ncbi:2Fe-2S iron-sulfur cluster-binding protein [uncultured Jatrophihabitans sp.]|uniref:2Fe-2S iron-sulfur cluster-binding protein n=1 Tax=uncultured Jatrophihabitans sp. TaxID=1610747 RepID=UPI0035CA92C7
MASPSSGPPSSFTVELRRSGRSVDVRADQSILDAVREIVDVDFFCRKGECGTCVSHVLEGLPLHLDTVLSDRARQANRRIAICVSRSQTAVLALDL